MNDFFAWNMSVRRPFDQRPAFTEAQCDELFALFEEAGLPETAMTAEMADGYLTGCQLGPNPVGVHEWMERIFGQSTLPICPDPVQQNRLLELLVQRQWDIMTALSVPREKLTPDHIFFPLSTNVADADRSQPYQLDANGIRLGDWDLKEWAAGFYKAVLDDDDWDDLTQDADAWPLLAPFLLLHKGFNPDKPELQLDQQEDLLPLLISGAYGIRDYWREHHRRMATARLAMQNPFVRTLPKPGRNDPCSCGSGKKHKKCCGAQ